MATSEQLQTRLDEAETAYHQLVTGQKEVTVSSSSGKSVTYTQANVGQLASYIASLKRQLGTSTIKPFRPGFG